MHALALAALLLGSAPARAQTNASAAKQDEGNALLQRIVDANTGATTVTPGTGTWNTHGSSVAAAQLGSYTVTSGTGSWTLSSSSSVARQDGVYTVTPGTGTWPVSGPLTDAQLRAAALNFILQYSSVVSRQDGVYTVTPGSGTWGVSGPLTDAQLRASAPIFILAYSSVVARQDQVYTVTPGSGTWSMNCVSGCSASSASGATTVVPGSGTWSVAFTTQGTLAAPLIVVTPTSATVNAAQLGAWSFSVLGTTFTAANPGIVVFNGSATVNAAQLGAWSITSGTMAFMPPPGMTLPVVSTTPIAISQTGTNNNVQLVASTVAVVPPNGGTLPVVSTTPIVLGAGTAVFGKLGANGGTTIGDVNVIVGSSIGAVGPFGQLIGSTQAFAAGSSSANYVVSLGNGNGKVPVKLTATLTSTAKTASQVILTYTVPSTVTFYLQGGSLMAFSTLTMANFSGSIGELGSAWWENPSGVGFSTYAFHTSSNPVFTPTYLPDMTEPQPVAAGSVIRCVVTPNTTMVTRWLCNLMGYEKPR